MALTPTPLVSLPESACPAKSMMPQQRQELAVAALAGESVSQLASTHDVSRKFVYQQADTARQALDLAFSPSASKDDKVLFHLPVTKSWIRQVLLGLILTCHSSFRGAAEWCRDHLDLGVSVGTVHNVVQQAVATARTINQQQDLSTIRIGAHDEIFQSGRPVLVGADVRSTYCYLLSPEEHRDADTWGVRLLELQDQGLRPDATIADGGTGLRAGQQLAWPDTPCRSDVFHVLRDGGQLLTFLENRALGTLAALDKIERQMAKAKGRGQGNQFSRKLASARQEQKQALGLASDIAILIGWLQNDVLAVAGPDRATRADLFDFIVAELKARESLCAHRIGPVRRLLENQRDDLLAFTGELDDALAELAREFQVSPAVVRDLLLLEEGNPLTAEHWQRHAALYQQLGERFYPLHQAVTMLASETVRASSVIENLNSRLRCYFFLRRHLGPEYLDLLRFFLNHRRFLRSEHPERTGKSPAELLTGVGHAHWLELLGFECFQRS